MRYLSGLLKIILFVFLLGFAVKNSDLVVLRYYLGYQWQAPLVLVILVFFTLGVIAGVAACLGYLFRQRRELQRLRQTAVLSRTVLAEQEEL